MASAINLPRARRDGFVPPTAQRGYQFVYRGHETNHCPGCGRTHWYIGRVMAECAFCATALPLQSVAATGGSQIVRIVRQRPAPDPLRAQPN